MNRDVLDLDIGQAILTTYDEGGFLGIGIDVPGGETSGTGTFDARFPYGTFGRSRDPDTSDNATVRIGATALFSYSGQQRNAWLLDDPRVTPKLPLASKGTWGAFADTGREDITVMVLDGTTGSFALRVPHSGSGVSRVLVDVETPGAEEILLANGGGCELAVKPLEVVIGNNALALALAKAGSVEGIKAALQALATSFIGLTGPLTPLQAIGTALEEALAAIPSIPTTKLRSE
jgi:hypothetical protein